MLAALLVLRLRTLQVGAVQGLLAETITVVAALLAASVKPIASQAHQSITQAEEEGIITHLPIPLPTMLAA
jgi:hypothetical protein